jgi:hypothetical protein
MTGREKPKRKALHRGLDDIVRRDASLTSRLLGRVKPVAREPLNLPSPEENFTDDTPLGESPSVSHEEVSSSPHQPVSVPRKRTETVTPLVSRRTVIAPEKRANAQTPASQPQHLVGGSSRTSDKPSPTLEKSPVISFKEFVVRWSFFLKSGNRTGKLRICEIIYNNTYAIGKETYFTSYEKLGKLAGLEKKQCAINVKQLEDLGFIERPNIYNTAKKQGTEFKLHLSQLPPQSRKSPRYHHYDEDI